ncbi:Spx/MgsR family RNA polymerase-binding regulatory protein [Candidatus Pandoraea novymonadis]
MYGISNCDSVKKACFWLDTHHITYCFHDFKKEGVPETLLNTLLTQFSIGRLLNFRSTTWRQLTDKQKAAATNESEARALIAEKPLLIKRPVLIKDGYVTVGFNPDIYASQF